MTTSPLIAPGAVWLPVPSHSADMRTVHLGLILHVTTNHFSPFGFFSNPANKASSTWWIGDDGRLEQYVDARLQAWAQADGNGIYHSVETSGVADELMTSPQLVTLAKLYAWGHQVLGWPLQLAEVPGQPGFGWHGMGGAAWGGHPYCPGIRRAQRTTVLDRARQLLDPGVDVDEPTLRAILADERAKTIAALDDRVRIILRGDAAGGLQTHPDNLSAIHADTSAIRTKLGA